MSKSGLCFGMGKQNWLVQLIPVYFCFVFWNDEGKKLVRPGTMKGQKFKIPEDPNFAWAVGRLWTQFGMMLFWNFPEFQKKTISHGDFGQHRPEKFSSRSWIRRGAI